MQTFNLFFCILHFFLLSGFSEAQNFPKVIVQPDSQVITEGDPFHFVCSVFQPIDSCRIHLPSAGVLTMDQDEMRNTSFDVDYFGDGFQKGECGLNVSVSDLASNGVFTCSMKLANYSILEVQGHANVTVRRKLYSPTLIINNTDFNENDKLEATCIMKNGKQPNGMSWYLGKTLITSEITQMKFDREMRESNLIGQKLITVVNRMNNGTKLRCLAQSMDDVYTTLYSDVTVFVSYSENTESKIILNLGGIICIILLIICVTIVASILIWRRTRRQKAEMDIRTSNRSEVTQSGIYSLDTML